jgi:hypothetical protein
MDLFPVGNGRRLVMLCLVGHVYLAAYSLEINPSAFIPAFVENAIAWAVFRSCRSSDSSCGALLQAGSGVAIDWEAQWDRLPKNLPQAGIFA